MARCSLILSNMEKSHGSHECGLKGLSNFGCLPWKCFPLNYYTPMYLTNTSGQASYSKQWVQIYFLLFVHENT